MPSWKSQCGPSPVLYLVKLSRSKHPSPPLSILHVLSKTKGSGTPTLRASAFPSAPSPLALGSALPMTESSHQTQIPERLTSWKCIYHSAYSLPGCLHGALGWHPLLPPQGTGCLNNTSSSFPSQKSACQDPHLHSLPLNQLQCLATSVSFKRFLSNYLSKMPLHLQSNSKVSNGSRVTWLLLLFHGHSRPFIISLLLTSQDSSIPRLSFQFIQGFFIMWSRLLSYQMLSSRNPETDYPSLDMPCFFTSLRLS